MPMSRLLVVLALLPSLALAQVNTEALRDAGGWTGARARVGATLAYASGNTDFLQVGADARVDVQGAATHGFGVLALRYAEADGARYVERSFAHARLTHPVAGRLAAEAFTQVEQNAQQRLAWRLLAGAGGRLALVERPSARLALGVTPMVEHERLRAEAAEPPATVARVSSYLAARLAVNEQTSLAATIYMQPRASVPADARVLATLAAEVQATRWVALRVQANLRHDTRPPAGVERTDVLVENGLVVTLPPR